MKKINIIDAANKAIAILLAVLAVVSAVAAFYNPLLVWITIACAILSITIIIND